MTITDPPASTVQELDASVVVDSDGSEIGQVGQVYPDNESGQSSKVTVKTGWFGTNESFVPLNSASIDVGTIRVPYDKEMIKSAPNYDAGGPLTETDEQGLYPYYGLRSAGGGDRRTALGDAEMPTRAADVDSGDYLTRSEEQLQVGTEKVQTGRARLRKVVVTEQQEVTETVRKEQIEFDDATSTVDDDGDIATGTVAAKKLE